MVNTTDISVHRFALPDSTSIFYRQAGSTSKPAFLLLHGYPASSFQYRALMPILAQHFNVIAPDLPGFGFTTVPKGYSYTFENLSRSIESFIDGMGIKPPFPVFIFDYGAPVALRIMLRRPDMFSAIVSQNGNAYDEGLGPAWEQFGIRTFWREPSEGNRDRLRTLLSLDATKLQYDVGHPDPASIPPESYTLDYHISNKNAEAMLDLFGDYKTNVALYPRFAEAFRANKSLRVLAIWGKNDPFFVPAGAHAYANDIGPDRSKVVELDAGHFALESHNDEIAKEILTFLL